MSSSWHSAGRLQQFHTRNNMNEKNLFFGITQVNNQPPKDMLDQACSAIANEVVDICTAFIQKTAVERAVPEMDKRLASVSSYFMVPSGVWVGGRLCACSLSYVCVFFCAPVYVCAFMCVFASLCAFMFTCKFVHMLLACMCVSGYIYIQSCLLFLLSNLTHFWNSVHRNLNFASWLVLKAGATVTLCAWLIRQKGCQSRFDWRSVVIIVLINNVYKALFSNQS